jgi:hypothetical protein
MSLHVEFPCDAVRVFEGAILFAEGLVDLHSSVRYICLCKGFGNPVDLGLVLAGQPEVIQPHSEWVETVASWRVGFWPANRL